MDRQIYLIIVADNKIRIYSLISYIENKGQRINTLQNSRRCRKNNQGFIFYYGIERKTRVGTPDKDENTQFINKKQF